MFNIKHIQDQKQSVDYLELYSSDHSSYAKIDLTLGGSLQELKLNHKCIISSEGMTPYKTTFMSSILFPFANRVENGKYTFNNKSFELDKSEADRYNALHGLVYFKTFKLESQDNSEKSVTVVVSYDETQPTFGFPFKYSVNLKYILTKNTLELKIEIENKDSVEFPFSVGWHPYFNSIDLSNSYLKFKSEKKLLVNDKMIPNGETEIDWNDFIQIEDKAFDDCFVLNTNEVEFKTPEYHLELMLPSGDNYLQLYTPDSRKCIAIEPQTAPANCFNNKIGLQILQPNKTYDIGWKINLK